jgi:hypothetical protein
MKELRSVVIFANGKKLAIPNADKIIMAIRGRDLIQHQASVDVTIPNVEQLKKIIRREP